MASANNPSSPLEKHVDVIYAVVIGLVVVLVTALLGFVIAYWKDHADSYQNLVLRVTEQQSKIDTLIQMCANGKTASAAVQPIVIYAQPGGQVQSATGPSH